MADLACMKSSKERIKGTDHVNSTRLILQLWHIRIYFILFAARDLKIRKIRSCSVVYMHLMYVFSP